MNRKKRSDENEGGLNNEGATREFMKKAKDDSRDVFQDIVEKVRAIGFLPYKLEPKLFIEQEHYLKHNSFS